MILATSGVEELSSTEQASEETDERIDCKIAEAYSDYSLQQSYTKV